MRTSSLALLIIAQAWASGWAAWGWVVVGEEAEAGMTLRHRIVGGEDAATGEFPFMVSVQHLGILGYFSHMCGGTIINDMFVLTAAHCVNSVSPMEVRVEVGMTDLGDTTGQVREVKYFIIHEDYNSITKANDLALLKLNQSLEMGEVEALGLPREGEVVVEGTPCIIVGWGAVMESGGVHDTLQKLEVKVVSDEFCRLAYGEAAVEKGMLCAGLGLGGAGACSGDQGDPLVCSGVLHGVASWSSGCKDSLIPGVYTEVSFFRDWIIIQTTQP